MAALAVALVLMAAAFIVVVRVLLRRIDAAEQQAHAAEDRADQAPERSRAVNMGKISEQLAPLLPGFGHDFKDVQWIGGRLMPSSGMVLKQQNPARVPPMTSRSSSSKSRPAKLGLIRTSASSAQLWKLAECATTAFEAKPI